MLVASAGISVLRGLNGGWGRVGGHLIVDWGAAAALALMLHLFHFLVHPGPPLVAQTEHNLLEFCTRVCPSIFEIILNMLTRHHPKIKHPFLPLINVYINI
jgi:hypothetical protein